MVRPSNCQFMAASKPIDHILIICSKYYPLQTQHSMQQVCALQRTEGFNKLKKRSIRLFSMLVKTLYRSLMPNPRVGPENYSNLACSCYPGSRSDLTFTLSQCWENAETCQVVIIGRDANQDIRAWAATTDTSPRREMRA